MIWRPLPCSGASAYVIVLCIDEISRRRGLISSEQVVSPGYLLGCTRDLHGQRVQEVLDVRGQGGSADLQKQERRTRDAEGQTGASVLTDGGAVCIA